MASAIVTIAAAHSPAAASACLAPAAQLSWALLCALQRYSPAATAAAARCFPNAASTPPSPAPATNAPSTGTRQTEAAAPQTGDSNGMRMNTPLGLGPSISLPPRDRRAPANLANAFRGNSKVRSCSGYSQTYNRSCYNLGCYSQTSNTLREDAIARPSSYNAKPPLPNLTSSFGSGGISPATAVASQPAVHLAPGWSMRLPNLAVHFAAFNAQSHARTSLPNL
ncbi:hypothetical protein CLOM_g11485 [Closterium sp. NIES-68]|nr:hypothetical protein CLOM_g11485 [Closterium sp. NIES-68]